MKKNYLVVTILMVLGMLLAACAPAAEEAAPAAEEAAPAAEEAMEEEAEEAAPADEPKVFALVTKSLNNTFWELMQDRLEEIVAENGDTLVYLAPTKAYNLEEQTRLVDDLIASGVDGIVLVPVDSEGMVPAVERVNAAGIPLALANTNAYGGERVTFSAVENYEAMEQIANYMVDELGGEGKVIVLEGTAGSQTAIDRFAAITDVMAANPGIEMVSQTAEFSRAKGLEVMENLIQAHPEFDAVMGVNDEMALGALEAMEAAGVAEGVIISGFDGNSDAVLAIKEGRILVTMFQDGPSQAGDALMALYDFLAGEDVPERIKTDAKIIDAANIADFEYLIVK